MFAKLIIQIGSLSERFLFIFPFNKFLLSTYPDRAGTLVKCYGLDVIDGALPPPPMVHVLEASCPVFSLVWETQSPRSGGCIYLASGEDSLVLKW